MLTARKRTSPTPAPMFAQQLDLRGSVVHIQCERYFGAALILGAAHPGDRRRIAKFTRDAAVSS